MLESMQVEESLTSIKTALVIFVVLGFSSSRSHILRLECKIFANFSIEVAGHSLNGYKIAEFRNVGLHQCYELCIHNPRCKSINIKEESPTICQLNNASSADVQDRVSLIKSRTWRYHTTNYSYPLVGHNCKELNPCSTNQLCLDTCSCPGYECLNCSNNSKKIHCNRCASNPCQNNGTCVEMGGPSLCVCSVGYGGAFCERDSCAPNPCQNGGSCLRSSGGYTCACPNTHTGKNCETAAISWEENCHYSLSLSFNSPSKDDCYSSCLKKIANAATFHPTSKLCYCSYSDPKTPDGGLECTSIAQDLTLERDCVHISTQSFGVKESRRACYDHCITNGYVSASYGQYHYDPDCYCSTSTSTTGSSIFDCILKKSV